LGNTVKIKVVKNKVAPPFKSAVVDIIYGQGISKEGELVDLGVQFGLVQKTGNWYEISGEKIGNGREATKDYFKAHPDVRKTSKPRSALPQRFDRPSSADERKNKSKISAKVHSIDQNHLQFASGFSLTRIFISFLLNPPPFCLFEGLRTLFVALSLRLVTIFPYLLGTYHP
jgi:hypothetical protein